MLVERSGGDFELGELCKGPDKVFSRIEFASATALHNGEPNGVGLTCADTAHEEPVLGTKLSVWVSGMET